MSLLQMFPSEYKETVTIVRRSAYERTGEDIRVAEDVICILQQRSDAAQRRDAVSVRSGVPVSQSGWTALLEKPNPAIAKGDFLIRPGVDVVVGQALSGSGDKTIANNLGSYAVAPTLKVTPSRDAELTDTSTPGAVEITYTDANGESETLPLLFKNEAKTTAQTKGLPGGATITQIRTTGWSTGTFDITTQTEFRVEGVLAETKDIGEVQLQLAEVGVL